MRRLAAVLVLALATAACAGVTPAGQIPDAETPDVGTPGTETRYEASVTVLQQGSDPAKLCWNVATSYPPQCGDVPITNWSWEDVEGEERMSGVIWGRYHVVGTYDGEVFTVTETGPPWPPPASRDDEIVTPCPEPEGGWTSSDPSRASESDVEAAAPGIRAEPDHAGMWIDHLGDPPTEAPADSGDVILIAAFTGDLERHRAEISEVWGGPLCVVELERTLAELERIQRELHDWATTELGLHFLSWSPAESRNRVEATVVLAGEDDQAALDERYGPGTVVLESALVPLA